MGRNEEKKAERKSEQKEGYDFSALLSGSVSVRQRNGARKSESRVESPEQVEKNEVDSDK